MMLDWRNKRPGALGFATGAVAGLVAITPAAGFVGPLTAIAIGVLASLICYYAVMLRMKWRIDESLDVLGVHGIGGIVGGLATGIFASKVINAAGTNGLLYGNPKQLLVQAATVWCVGIYSFAATWIIAKAIDATIGLRVADKEEEVGLDISQHAAVAYSHR